MFAIRAAVAAIVIGAMLLTGCSPSKTPKPAPGSGGEKPPVVENKHPELNQPFDNALKALLAMNEAGQKKDFVTAEQHFKRYRENWALIRKALVNYDPKLEVHLEDGAVELDVEFRKPEDQIRVYELDEETVKLGRLLAKAAALMGVPIDQKLIKLDPTEEFPFNKHVTVTINMTDHKFEPKVIEVNQHDKVTFKLVNKGREVHEFEFGYYAVEVEDILPGTTGELTMVMLDAGEFEFACHLPGHYEVGMLGTIKVKPAELKK